MSRNSVAVVSIVYDKNHFLSITHAEIVVEVSPCR